MNHTLTLFSRRWDRSLSCGGRSEDCHHLIYMERYAKKLVCTGYNLSDDPDRGNKSILPTDTSAQTEPYIPMVKEKESHDHRRRRGRKKSDHRDPEQ